ncbi:MAG TPA: O-methyltransferase [Acidimicrobiales bacterium]|jgi:predicted O-methyltransferase YrrM|nr:O-methyltransferase [Acidimicrobiales bacterium]
MTEPTYEQIDTMLSALVAPSDDALAHALRASTEGGLPPIQVAAVQGKLLQILVQAIGATTVLEVGTLGGYSTIHLARGLREGGRVTTLELDEHHAEVARANLTYAGLAEAVDVLVGPALETLALLKTQGFGPADLVFIDADKVNNTNYLRYGLEFAHPGTLLVVDNVVRAGAVAIDPLPDESARGAREAIEFLGSEPRVEATVLQVVGAKGHDGLLFGLVTG